MDSDVISPLLNCMDYQVSVVLTADDENILLCLFPLQGLNFKI